MSKLKCIIVIFLAAILLLCGGSEKQFMLFAQINNTIYVDTTFTITWTGESNQEGIPIQLTRFGCSIEYNPDLIECISFETYNLFDIEQIGMRKDIDGNEIPGTLELAFAQFDTCDTVLICADSVFSVTVHVKKEIGDGQRLNINILNAYAELCGKRVEMQGGNVVADLRRKLIFILRTIIN